MSSPRMQGSVAVVLIAMSAMLSGCSFGTSQDKSSCNGDACDCTNSYYGMEAGMYIVGVPIEHASLHVTIPRVEPDTANSTGCCVAMYDLFPIREREARVNKPSAADKDTFCKHCAKSPNAEVSDAAKSCPAPSASFLLSSPTRGSMRSRSVDPPGADAYSDCSFDVNSATISILNGKSVSGARVSFNIRWTDLRNSSTNACCEAIPPLIKQLYGLGSEVTPSERQNFCSACKAAYNTGVALAAFRLSTATVTHEFDGKTATEHADLAAKKDVSEIV